MIFILIFIFLIYNLISIFVYEGFKDEKPSDVRDEFKIFTMSILWPLTAIVLFIMEFISFINKRKK